MAVRSVRLVLLVIAALAAMPSTPRAQGTWPDRPVRIIVPFPPGGGTEAVARLLAMHLQETLRQPFVVESRSGASGMLGTELGARAAADGYTLTMTASGPLSILPQMLTAPYDPIRSFEHVALPAITPLVMVVPVNRPPTTVQEFVAWARRNAGRVNYCSIGVASPSHLSAELFRRSVDIEMTHIPHRGSGPAIIDTIAGHCDVLFDSTSASGPHAREGRLRALGISTPDRHPSWRELPTIAEQGVAGYATSTWSGLVAPAGTPAPIIARLNAEARRFATSARERERIETQGGIVMDLSPTQFRAYLQEEIARWGEVIRAGNIRAE